MGHERPAPETERPAAPGNRRLRPDALHHRQGDRGRGIDPKPVHERRARPADEDPGQAGRVPEAGDHPASEEAEKGISMASISRGPNGRRTIQFVASDGKRKSIRLGKMPQRVAEEVKIRVESLIAAKVAGLPLDGETARWVAKIGDDLAAKLAAVGLIPARVPPEAVKPIALDEFLDTYIAGRTDLKASTRRSMESARNRLVEFFGAD